MYKVLSKCPVCTGEIKITKIKCCDCNTVIENEFSLNKFEKLNKDQLMFVEVFLGSRGNIKDVEKELGISYPTVRSKLDEVNGILGLSSGKSNAKEIERKRIMDMLEEGQISSDEAVRLLKKL